MNSVFGLGAVALTALTATALGAMTSAVYFDTLPAPPGNTELCEQRVKDERDLAYSACRAERLDDANHTTISVGRVHDSVFVARCVGDGTAVYQKTLRGAVMLLLDSSGPVCGRGDLDP